MADEKAEIGAAQITIKIFIVKSFFIALSATLYSAESELVNRRSNDNQAKQMIESNPGKIQPKNSPGTISFICHSRVNKNGCIRQ